MLSQGKVSWDGLLLERNKLAHKPLQQAPAQDGQDKNGRGYAEEQLGDCEGVCQIPAITAVGAECQKLTKSGPRARHRSRSSPGSRLCIKIPPVPMVQEESFKNIGEILTNFCQFEKEL